MGTDLSRVWVRTMDGPASGGDLRALADALSCSHLLSLTRVSEKRARLLSLSLTGHTHRR